MEAKPTRLAVNGTAIAERLGCATPGCRRNAFVFDVRAVRDIAGDGQRLCTRRPFVCALASRDVPVSGETFVVGGGRAARVLLETVVGLNGITTIDDCLARFDEAMSTDQTFHPSDADQQVVFECEQVGVDFAALSGCRVGFDKTTSATVDVSGSRPPAEGCQEAAG